MTREQAQQSLSALLLGELDEQRAKEVLGWVERDAELSQELAELSEVLELSTSALQLGPAPRLRAFRRFRLRVAAFRPLGVNKSAFALPAVVLASLLLLLGGPEPPTATTEHPAQIPTVVAMLELETEGAVEAVELAIDGAPVPRERGATGSGAPKPGSAARRVPASGASEDRGASETSPRIALRDGMLGRAPPASPPPRARRAPDLAFPPAGRRPPPSPSFVRPPMINFDRFLYVDDHPLSTFSTDVDTASYSRLRKSVREGVWPDARTRIEELINYFPYDEFEPTEGPIAVRSELTRAPWDDRRWLAKLSLRAARSAERTARNLVFLVDVSGSMDAPDKLPLLVDALTLLVRRLTASDRISIVAYAGYSGVLLEPTAGDRKDVILRALRSLSAGGSTNGAGGIVEAYRLARESWVEGGVNRVMLATDGDFNVGVDSPDELERLIAHEAETGVYLSALGFGRSAGGDARLEALAGRGNGNYAFIDDLAEAEKVFGEELEATTTVAAHDVKIQVEFDPEVVRSYRLIGYDDRRLEDEDFADDRVDAGDLGAGHSVTAVYELDPRSRVEAGSPLRVKVRYKASRTSPSELLIHEVAARPVPFSSASRDTRFAVAVTAFGGFVRGYSSLESLSLSEVERWAARAASGPGARYRQEFVELVARMRTLSTSSEDASRGAPPDPGREGCAPPYYVDPVTGVRKPKPHCIR